MLESHVTRSALSKKGFLGLTTYLYHKPLPCRRNTHRNSAGFKRIDHAYIVGVVTARDSFSMPHRQSPRMYTRRTIEHRITFFKGSLSILSKILDGNIADQGQRYVEHVNCQTGGSGKQLACLTLQSRASTSYTTFILSKSLMVTSVVEVNAGVIHCLFDVEI